MSRGRILVAAPHSGSGKTTFCLGLLGALRRRGLGAAPFKVGPDYIDTAYHARISGRAASNLDAFLLGESALARIFAKRLQNADIAVIEGVMGLFDGVGSTSEASTAQVAALLKAPVIFVVDGRGMAASASALVGGFMERGGGVRIAGVVFNNVREGHYRILKQAVERDCRVPCLGYLPPAQNISIESRHLGILPEAELSDADARLERMADLIEAHIDLGGVLRIAASAPELPLTEPVRYAQNPCTLAVAKDAAFNFYYEDSLDVLREMGARLVLFSPLEDEALPDCDGAYIGGGFPEMFAGRLEANRSMRASIRKASRLGMPIYGECGGYIYLSNSLAYGGKTYEMCGALDARAAMGAERSARFGYVTVTQNVDTPICTVGGTYRAHEFHHSAMSGEGNACVAKKGGMEWAGGSVSHNTYGTYAHVHFAGAPELAERFLGLMGKR